MITSRTPPRLPSASNCSRRTALRVRPNLKPCPKGEFVATNANGQPNGFGPNGKPDGGLTCQTPQQYASFNTGWDGAGPAWQSLKLNDNSADYRYQGTHSIVHVGLFNSFYENLIDRTFFLPNLAPRSARTIRGTAASGTRSR